jgi:imidazole glycerol phosphate synthase subunit HisF
MARADGREADAVLAASIFHYRSTAFKRQRIISRKRIPVENRTVQI